MSSPGAAFSACSPPSRRVSAAASAGDAACIRRLHQALRRHSGGTGNVDTLEMPCRLGLARKRTVT